jgi:hypothetical protein
METVSPTAHPKTMDAIGDMNEMRPDEGSASSTPTMVIRCPREARWRIHSASSLPFSRFFRDLQSLSLQCREFAS